mgnify:CR=1 FL=1
MVRKMVSVQKIEGVYPIENADRIEKARIGGWIVVVGKDMGLKPGDHVAYFEIDSMLPPTTHGMRNCRNVGSVPCQCPTRLPAKDAKSPDMC